MKSQLPIGRAPVGQTKNMTRVVVDPPTAQIHKAGMISRRLDRLVLLEGIELSTSPLPRGCSTTELQQPEDASGRVHSDSNRRQQVPRRFRQADRLKAHAAPRMTASR